MLTGKRAVSCRLRLAALAEHRAFEVESRQARRVLCGVLTLALVACFAAPAGALSLVDRPGFGDLLYDTGTGNVRLDPTDVPLAGFHNFVFRNAAGGSDFDTGASLFPGHGIFTNLPLEVSWADLFSAITGVYDLGDILPPGLDLSELDAFLTEATYVGQLGSGVQVFDAILFLNGQVPEPGASVLAAIAAVALVGSQRRRALHRQG